MYKISEELKNELFNEAEIIKEANQLLKLLPKSITDSLAANSIGGPNDYYSNGDYWWPNPETHNGLPYIVRDGQTNPDNFSDHRLIMREMRHAVTYLAMAWKISKNINYAKAAFKWLDRFFVNKETRMNPHLCYAQAIPGLSHGRGIGIIDTLHLIEVPQAIEVLKPVMTNHLYEQLVHWFKTYMLWMNTHPNGIEEKEWPNNHSVVWFAQVASFARFTKDHEMLNMCINKYKTVLLPGQMDRDGSFPKELDRTKPYSYSNFVLDNMANICLFASNDTDDLWRYINEEGLSLQKGLDFLLSYIKDKKSWPYQKDIQHFEQWPLAMSYLLFSGIELDNKEYISVWKSLDKTSNNKEILRNMAIQCPMLYFDW